MYRMSVRQVSIHRDEKRIGCCWWTHFKKVYKGMFWVKHDIQNQNWNNFLCTLKVTALSRFVNKLTDFLFFRSQFWTKLDQSFHLKIINKKLKLLMKITMSFLLKRSKVKWIDILRQRLYKFEYFEIHPQGHFCLESCFIKCNDLYSLVEVEIHTSIPKVVVENSQYDRVSQNTKIWKCFAP